MNLVVRGLMILSWTVLASLLAVFVVLGFKGNLAPVYLMVDLPADLPVAQHWAIGVTGMFFTFGLAALGLIFWTAHRMMAQAARANFLYLATHLKWCAWALICFWVSYALVMGALPRVLLASLPLKVWPPLDWFPIDPEITFLIIAFPLLAISRALKRAAVIEEENSQFL